MNENLDYKELKVNYNAGNRSQSSDMFFNNQIWRVEDVARFLKCSTGHIYNLVNKRRIPNTKRGKLLFFIPSLIFNWVLEGDYK